MATSIPPVYVSPLVDSGPYGPIDAGDAWPERWRKAPAGPAVVKIDRGESWENPEWHSLGNNTVTATPPTLEALREGVNRKETEAKAAIAGESRQLRYELRETAAQLSHHGRIGKCGRCRYLDHEVAVVVGHGRARYTGLVRCGSVWECPTCMYRIASQRSDDLRVMMARHRAAGGGAYMLTCTLPHDDGDALRPMRRHVAWAWSKAQAGAAYKRLKKKVGLVGTVRAMEVTHGLSGWHPHLHVLVLTDKPLSSRHRAMYERIMFVRWSEFITRRNQISGVAYRPPSKEHGVTFVECHKDDYISKLGLADELTRGTWKKSRELRGYRSPLKILQDVTRRGVDASPRDCALWLEYADEMHGARQLTFSRGLRARYALPPEQTDLQLAESEDDDAGSVVYTIPSMLWDRYLRNNVRARLSVLSAAERAGWDGVQYELDVLQGRKPLPF